MLWPILGNSNQQYSWQLLVVTLVTLKGIQIAKKLKKLMKKKNNPKILKSKNSKYLKKKFKIHFFNKKKTRNIKD